MAMIKEIFASIQGEGPFVGYKQLFVRFCGCNLHCKYCDTDFEFRGADDYSVEALIRECEKYPDCHSISLTGGEPLLHSEFLEKFLPKCPIPVYLETNSTLVDELERVIEYITYIAADIKLPSTSGNEPLWEIHDKFFKMASRKNLFAKVVFDENITPEEICQSADLCKKYGIELILQPKMDGNKCALSAEYIQKVLEQYLKHYSNTRVIPQTHKFINVR